MRGLVAFLIAALGAATSAQVAQQPARPAFASRVDLLAVQAAVVDKDGKPVQDLQPSDFSVTVAGQPRKVTFARFYGSGEKVQYAETPGTPAMAASASTPPGSTGAGRLVLFVVDRETIRSGSEKALFDSGARIVDALGPADAVGLVELPTGGVKPTREHQRVVSALRNVTGTMPNMPWRWFISWREAEGIERGDAQALNEALNRECRAARKPAKDDDRGLAPRSPEGCAENIPAQAREMLMTARAQARATLANLRGLMARLKPLRGPKHVVFMSGGMRFDQELLGEFNQAAEEAARAGVVLHTIHLDQPATDAGTEHRTITQAFGGREMSQGLTTMSGMTGGSFFQGVGTAAGVFERIGTEITNFYELGLESVAADADGSPRELEVKVTRPGLSVRTRRHVALDPSVAPRTGTPEAVQALLEQPTDLLDLPLHVSTFTMRGDDPSLLKVLMAIDMGAAQSRGPAQWGFIILNEGNVIASGRSSLDTAAPGPWTFTASAKLLPGRQRLRFAAIDADGRAGVVDLPLAIGLRVSNDLQLSDLVVGAIVTGRFQPGTRVAAGVPLAAMIEVLSNDVTRLARTRVALEIAPQGSSEPLQRLLMAARTGIADTILINEAQINTMHLVPGHYVATAITLIDNEPVGKVTREFDVIPAATR
jgi:VWFA-related protein